MAERVGKIKILASSTADTFGGLISSCLCIPPRYLTHGVAPSAFRTFAFSQSSAEVPSQTYLEVYPSNRLGDFKPGVNLTMKLAITILFVSLLLISSLG